MNMFFFFVSPLSQPIFFGYYGGCGVYEIFMLLNSISMFFLVKEKVFGGVGRGESVCRYSIADQYVYRYINMINV